MAKHATPTKARERNGIPGGSAQNAVVDIELDSVIRKALPDAWAQGSDLETANKQAVARVLAKRPDMTAADVLRVVNLVRRS